MSWNTDTKTTLNQILRINYYSLALASLFGLFLGLASRTFMTELETLRKERLIAASEWSDLNRATWPKTRRSPMWRETLCSWSGNGGKYC